MFSKKFLGGAALTALTMAAGANTQALAQSTGTEVFESNEIVVTGARGARNIEGLITAETVAKSRSTVSSEYIQSQAPGQTILDNLNLVPGVTFSNNDAYGAAGGQLNIRGFDGARVSLQFDGAQLNDTGNYAIYSSQQLDSELIEKATVNLGTTDTDSPTASATGGTVNYTTRLPTEEFGAVLQYGYGSNDFNRVFAMVDTGAIGPYGTRAFVSVSSTEYDHFLSNFGGIDRNQFNARVYQELGDNGDFISLSAHYNEARNNFIRQVSVDRFNNTGLNGVFGNQSACQGLQAAVAGTEDAARNCNNLNPSLGGFSISNGNTTVGPLNTNPSNTGNLRGQSRFSLTDSLTLTIDPTFQYTLANGGSTFGYSERTGTSNSGVRTGVDLNGDGDILDTVLLFQPNTTNTRRYSLQSSLIWEINDDHRVRGNFTFDRGYHRQTGRVTSIGIDSNPNNVFGGHESWGTSINDARGVPIRRRDRFSIAELVQYSVEYRGDFLDDRLTLTAGVRATELKRELNNFCFQGLDFNGNNPICTTDPAQIAALSANAEVQAPFKGAEVSYDDILPNVGLSFRPAEGHQLFVSYAEGLSAPRTDDLYGRRLNALSRVEPETSKAYDIGYRFSNGVVVSSLTGWFNEFTNRIERTFDPVTNDTGSFNAGSIDLWGVDGEIGWRATDALSVYASASWKDSEIQNNIGTNRTQGKKLYDTAEWTYAGRAEYEVGNFDIGVQARFVDERFTNLVNDEKTPSFTVVDADVRWNLGDLVGREGVYLQINAINIFEEEYLGNINTDVSGNRNAQVGAPQTFLATIRTTF